MAVQNGVIAGRIAKPYGLRGEVQLIQIPSSTEYFKEGTFLFIEMDGQLVPFFMEEVDLPKAGGQAIVKFEFIDDKESARRISGCEVYFDPKLKIDEAEEASGLLSLQGYVALDKQHGELGEIKEILVQTSNSLWVIEGRMGEILVPAVDDFVVKTDPKKQVLYLELPEGLIGD